ncbi:uncharacterized protein N7529_008247 [Penicillium soppii]|uniref:uncharacterized protein n=1 Tax=Penicillium soppii TaxID=69789 RepID=UPI00254999DA|nr:uncharacterized protein N7529_008247 [Penicillium soppii]KAJ5860937.1 hypothetical protein N7529_008247 [Penicillium soppii]
MSPSLDRLPGLPDDPLFERLLYNAQNIHSVLIRDTAAGIEATPAQFLRDIIFFQDRINIQLATNGVSAHDVAGHGDIYICILAPLSYEFLVAFYAVIALGGVAVPLSTSILPEEGAWILNKCRATCLLVGTNQGDLASQIRSEQQPGLDIPIELALGHNSPALSSTATRESFNPNGPGLVLFTSGTTGPPKGVVLPRCFFFPNVELDCTSHDIALVYRPVNGLSGILNLMDLIYAGACAELFPGGIQPAIIWERLRQGGVTVLAGATRFWQLLMLHYEENLSRLPSSDLQEYRDGAHNLRVAWFGGGLPSPVARRFWLRLRTGKSWIVKYGSSETGREAFSFRFRKEEEIAQPVIGTPLPGVTAKLTEGDHGELLLKSPTMMIGYLDDEQRTRETFDNEGYYKTGDLVHRESSGLWIIDGRATVDFVRFNGLRVSVNEVESHVCELPYIGEAYVLCIPDLQYGQRVGCLVRRRNKTGDMDSREISLEQLRRDLSDALSVYKLPSILKVLEPHAKLPTSPQGKLARSQAIKMYFLEDTQSSCMEVWPLDAEDLRPKKAWDWGGVAA